MRGSRRPNVTAIFWPPLLRPWTLCLSRSPDAQPEALGSTLLGLAFFTASYQPLLWSPNSIGVTEGPLGRVWLSLPILVYNSVSNCLELQLNWNRNSTGRPTQLPSWLRYMTVQRPLDRPLDLWNRMFNRHQAEITVMQFTGHSLPVHQSMSVPWEFF